ncbi:MAG: serine hydrolase [Clostridia bacterium]
MDNNFLNLETGSAILIEQNSGQMLYGYNIHEKLHPASVTKVMSLLLIMEALDSGKITLDTPNPL